MGRAQELVDGLTRVIFDAAVGPSKWDNEFWYEERIGCEQSARAALLYLLSHLPEGTDLRTLREEIERM